MGLLGDFISEVTGIREEFDELKNDITSSAKEIVTGATDLTEETAQHVKENAGQLSDAAADVKKNITGE